MHYEYSDSRNSNRISIDNTLRSLGAWNGVLSILLSITSTWIQTVLDLEDYFYSTNNIFHYEWIYTNCYWITAYCLSFTMSHASLYVLMYLLRYLLRKPHHCDDADFFVVAFTGTIVLQNERIPSKDNELRLKKATSLPRYHNKEVCKRNRRYMYCTRQEQTITVTVFTMVFY